jgi:hypothetical protein
MVVIVTGIGGMEDFECVEKLEVILTGIVPKEDTEEVQKLEVSLKGKGTTEVFEDYISWRST